MKHLGLICSGGGAVMAAAHDLLVARGRSTDWAIVTDRPCGAEDWATARGIPVQRLRYGDKDSFSAQAADWLFGEMGCDKSLLFFTRLVGNPIYQTAPCINLHPSLLPLFSGLGSLKATAVSGMRVFGATAHLVDQSTDGGPILAQVWCPKPADRVMIERVSFAQKLYLMLVLDDWAEKARAADFLAMAQSHPSSASASAQPALSDGTLEAAFHDFLVKEGIPWPV